MLSAFADDDSQFDFPVGLLAVFGDDEIVVRPDPGAGCFEENDWLARRLKAGFLGVVGEVEADTDKLAGTRDGGPESFASVDSRSRV